MLTSSAVRAFVLPDVLFSYLTSTNYDFQYDKTHNVRPKRNIRMAMQHEISMYAIAQKEGNGLDKAVEDCKYRMKRYGVTPNMLIIAPQLALYMALAPEEKLTYKEGGPTALASFEAGAEGFTTRSFRGCGVVTSDPFEVSDETEAVQMLQRFTQVGEHYIMGPPVVDPEQGTKGFLDMMLYDEESDKFARVSFLDAFFATCADQINATTPMEDGTTLTDWKTKILPMLAANEYGFKAANAAVPADAMVAAKFRNTVGLTTKTMVEAEIAKLTSMESATSLICLARPFIEHAMLSAVLTVSGQDTGATLFGPSDMQISANTSVKTIEGHYTGHFKSVITKPQNVFVMKDIMSNGYRAGGNAKFFGDGRTKESISNAVVERLNLEDADSDVTHGSVLAFPIMAEQAEKLQTEVSISSRLLPWDVHAKTMKSFPGGRAMYDQYKDAFGLQSIHFGEDLRASENMEYMSQGSVNNALCFTGPCRKYDTITKAYTSMTPGMGHWGPDARPGDARWRRGEAVSMMSAREAMLTYEQLQYIPKPRV